MTKFFIIALLAFSFSSQASELLCNIPGLKEARKPIQSKKFSFCFFFTSANEGTTTATSTDPEAISVYFSSGKAQPEFLYELPYSGTESIIEDAFLVTGRESERIAVIHSSDAPSTFEIAGRLYDVTVFDTSGKRPELDFSANKFFDGGGDLSGPNGNITYRYPYKTREKVISALHSPIYSAASEAPVSAIVTNKAFLYLEPSSREISKTYLIQGDVLSVEDATAGWCNVRYRGKSKSIIKWMHCEFLEPVEPNR
ncbi:hypothetical protein [Stenotrophomonas sp. MMGLT7]|uniref:hypothetical protein n=1 Tax=Stenotrophomonas sp. MMGLT7 TaxID=2901227 RepID=UPI001E3EB165|nr:hypothetical protein [Stenotrophomonas sp. MMGLT7]MCD7099391.1 hypothetical protein [Stenotrophomonas sp. MMGLT7]